jgi:4-amino-4-deoxy-L-arabinose transferase-like glycosyltransferase
LETVLVIGAFDPAPHTGGDNAIYVSLAHALLTTGSYVELFDPAQAPHTKYPPVFPAVLALLMAFGARTWVALKSVAVLSTIAAVAFTYLWAARRLGPWTASAVAALVGVSSAVVYYSHWVLSDPLFLALTMAGLWALDVEGGAGRTDASAGRSRAWWLALGIAAAGLAYFTRSAGLPLVAALLGWLALGRRWRALALGAVALGGPALWWWARARGASGSYAAEFWLVDPYQPALGRIEPWALVPRALTNLRDYASVHVPAGIVGSRGAWVSALGVALTLAALYGWARAVRTRFGIAELFFPLYSGLIFLWPVVWSGDRFALPLYPLLFLYAALAWRTLVSRLPRAARGAATAVILLALLGPATASWLRASAQARACMRIVVAEGAWACYGPRVEAFVAAARWARAGLPEGASVLTRKPGIFYVESGVPSRTFPLVPDPEAHLGLADSLGARYTLLDEWDGLAAAYVGSAVRRRPGAFCFVRSFGEPGAGGAQLLGILPPLQRELGGASGEGRVRIEACPPEYAAPGSSGAQATSSSASSSSTAIPLLEGLDP